MTADELLGLIQGYGVPGVFCMALSEKFIPVVPSYLMLMVFGLAAATGPALALVAVVSIVGSLLGTLGWYGIGSALGQSRTREAVARYGRFVFLRLATYDRLSGAYRRNTFRVTLAGQGIPVARIYLALPAGVIGVPFPAFAAAAVIGIALYNATFLGVGFLLRDATHAPLGAGLAIAAGLVILELIVLMWSRRRRRLA